MFGFTGINAAVVFRVIFGILVYWNSNELSWAQETIFNSRDIFLKTTCEHCTNNSKKSIVSAVQNKSDTKKILLFIDPQCSWCKKAIHDLGSLKRKHADWAIQVYVMSTVKEFIEYFRSQGRGFPKDLEYTLDFKNALANKYEIGQTPTYIIMDHGKTQRIKGYVDLLHFNLDHVQ